MNVKRILFLTLIAVALFGAGVVWAAVPSCVVQNTKYCKHQTLVGAQTEESLSFTGSVGHVYNITGDLVMNADRSVTTPSVVFVQGSLTINSNLTHNSESAGLVFVVNGDVNISKDVNEIDAVLISYGKIFTAGAGCAKNSVEKKTNGTAIDQLLVKGSLISLGANKAIEFCRNLAINDKPAERVDSQPKYLVILKDVFGKTMAVSYEEGDF